MTPLESSKKYYARHRDTILARHRVKYNYAKVRAATLKHRAKRHLVLDWYKIAHPCVDCGEVDIVVLQFDHLPGFTKSWNVGGYGRTMSLKKMLIEIEKCEVVCANCHVRRTKKRKTEGK